VRFYGCRLYFSNEGLREFPPERKQKGEREYIINRGRLIGAVVTLKGYLFYRGDGKASLRRSVESATGTDALVSHFPNNVRAQMVDHCESGCPVAVRARVTAGGLWVIDMDVGPLTNIPRGHFY
jgi:hypothetical protein